MNAQKEIRIGKENHRKRKKGLEKSIPLAKGELEFLVFFNDEFPSREQLRTTWRRGPPERVAENSSKQLITQ